MVVDAPPNRDATRDCVEVVRRRLDKTGNMSPRIGVSAICKGNILGCCVSAGVMTDKWVRFDLSVSDLNVEVLVRQFHKVMQVIQVTV